MILVDTSAWIDALRADGDDATRGRVASALSAGTAVICPIVELELWNGASGEAQQAKIRRLVETLHSLSADAAVWQGATSLALDLRLDGVTIPATDLLIAATALQNEATLLHNDRHFLMIAERVPDLHVAAERTG